MKANQELSISNNAATTQQIQLERLSPYVEADLTCYQDILDNVFEDPQVNNIALSGSYGSGKSSILLSYENSDNGKNKKFIHISLSHFSIRRNLAQGENKQGISSDDKMQEEMLERKIVNQLLHQIDVDSIPLSGLDIKRPLKSWKLVLSITALVTCVICGAFFFSPDILIELFTDKSTLERLHDGISLGIAQVFSLAVSICTFGWLSYQLIGLLYTRHPIKTVSFHGNQVGLDSRQELPFFDKYLAEILYLFDNCDADAIAFEDVDRFDSITIFERLREISSLVNSRENRKHKKLKFFYLLRDDIFSDPKERTKYFDLIIPVIPVIDSSNSYDVMLKRLETISCHGSLDTKFLQGLSIYLDDMRIVNNIFNEFAVYNKRLSTIELDPNKMLAMITYKNLFPCDFSKLHHRSGFIAECFERKTSLKAIRLERLNNEINVCKEKIAAMDKELSENQGELDTIYHNTSLPQDRYLTRKVLLEDRIKGDGNKQRDRISLLEKQKTLIATSYHKLADILQEPDANNMVSEIAESYTEIKGNEYSGILFFLLQNGYIDETYPDYMTYFYGNSLTTNDKNFIRAVWEGQSKEWDYHLDNVSSIVERLMTSDFERPNILNFDIFHHLLHTPENNTELENFLETAIYACRTKFIQSYLLLDWDYANCVHKINKSHHEFFHDNVKGNMDFSPNQKWKYALYTLAFNQDILISIDIEYCLSDYIRSNNMFLNFKWDIDDKLLLSGLLSLGIRFQSIADIEIESRIDLVYRDNLYSLNPDNIVFLLNRFCGMENEKINRNEILTHVFYAKDSNLYKYLTSDFKSFLCEIKVNSGTRLQDSEDTVYEILNTEEIAIDSRITYISEIDTQLANLSKVNNEQLRSAILDNSKAGYSLKNIGFLYSLHDGSMSKDLVEFMNSFKDNPTVSINGYDMAGKEYMKMFLDIISESEIENTLINDLIYKSRNLCFLIFDREGIRSETIDTLINLRMLEMNEQIFHFIEKAYPDSLCLFVKKGFKAFRKRAVLWKKKIAQITLNKLLASTTLTISQKMFIIKNFDFNVDLSGIELTPQIIRTILVENKFEHHDIVKLFPSYDSFPYDLKQEMAMTTAKIYHSTSLNMKDIPDMLITDMLSSKELTVEEKTKLFCDRIGKAKNKKETAVIWMKSMGYDWLATLLYQGGIIDSEDLNESNELFKALQDNNLISLSGNQDDPEINIKPV